jgi:hypothetical protein
MMAQPDNGDDGDDGDDGNKISYFRMIMSGFAGNVRS